MQIQFPALLQTSCVKLDKSLHLSASGFICKMGMVCSCTHQMVVAQARMRIPTCAPEGQQFKQFICRF